MIFNINSPIELLYRIIAVVLALTVHEFSHGFAASLMGDTTAKNEGRLTLNPLKHIDILGSLMLLVAGFGWAKPVGVNPMRFKNPKVGMAITAFAGPLSNFILAFLCYLAAVLVNINSGGTGVAGGVITCLVICTSMNIGLGIFNLIPVPPLDGSRIFLVFLPESLYFRIMQYERYIQLAIIALIFLGALDVPLGFLTRGMWSIIQSLVSAIVLPFI